MPFVLRPPTDALPALAARLADLGRARRLAAVVAGVFRVIAVGVGAVLAAGLLDVVIHLPAAVRAVFLVGVVGAVGAGYVRWVRGPGRLRVGPLDVAFALEARFPRLNDSLASAVAFLQAGDVAESRFRRVSVTRAQNLARRYDFDSIVPSGRAWRAFWLAVAAFAVTAPAVVFDPASAARALIRLVDPFGSHPWPTKTTVEVVSPTPRAGGGYLLAKGEQFPLKVVVRGVVPESAVVSVRPAGGAMVEDGVPVTLDLSTGQPVIDHPLDANRAGRDFEFRVRANDADTGWLRVAVAPAPKLVPLDGRPSPLATLVFPAYTDLPPTTLPDGTGVIEAVSGTRVRLRAATDRRIVAAVFHNLTDLTPVAAALAATAVAGDYPLGPLAARMLADDALADIPVAVTGSDGTTLEADFTPTLPGLYALRFTDEQGLTGIRLFDVRTFPDPAPKVLLERPLAGRDPLTLLPTASVVVAAHAEDRPYAVRSLVLEYRVGPDDTVRVIPLADLAAAWPGVPAVAGGVAARSKPVAADGGLTVPIARFRKGDGSSPADGDVIAVRATAYDWDDRTALKEPGRSTEVEIRVLGKASLDSLIQKELSALRPDLLRLREEQKSAREKTAEAANAAGGGLRPDDLGKLAQAEQGQRTVRNKVGDPDAGLRAKADQLREAVRANNLPRSPTTDKVERVADDLGRLADQHLDAADPLLAAARQEAEKTTSTGAPNADKKAVADLLNKAGRHQKAAEDGLAGVLEKLEQWGGPGEIRGDAQALKDQLNRAGAQAAKAATKVADGKPAADLKPDEKAELAAPAAKLDEAADRANELVTKATRIAGEKEEQARADRATAAAKDKAADEAARGQPSGSKDAETAAARAEAAAARQSAGRAQAEADALRAGVREAGGDALAQDVRQAARDVRDNKLGQSAAARQSAADRLDRLADALTEKPKETADELRKKLDRTGDEVNKLAEQQDELRKKAKEAASIPDPGRRAEELNKLSREQEKLARKAEDLAQRLTRDRADKPADAVRRAAEQMDAARDELEQGRPPADKQDEALDRLDEALNKLDREKKEDREQLSREQREQLADGLKAVRDKQKAAVDEAARLQAEALKAKGWSRALQASLKDLEDREKALAGEVRQFADKSLAELPVFGRLAGQSAAAMDRAARLVGERRDDLLNADPFDPQAEAATANRVSRPMQTALRRLDQILDSLKNDPMARANGGGSDQPGGGMPPGDGAEGQPAGGQGGGVPPLAQLKALRAMQAEVAERTTAFAKDYPDRGKLTDDQRDELKELEQAQRDVAELFDKLAPAFRPAAPEIP